MEIFGTSFALALGSWKLRFGITLVDTDATPVPATTERPARRPNVTSERDVRDRARAGIWKN
jgi:hypothetical protein